MPWSEDDTASSLPRRFEEQAQRTPDAVAIADGEEHLTYGRLAELTDRWAEELPAAVELPPPVGGRDAPAARAAILLPHGVPVIAGALAAMKAGFSVLVLNPEDPPARHARLAELARPTVTLTDAALAPPGGAAGFDHADTIRVSMEGGERGRDRPGTVREPDDLAVLIATSGSTGAPKLVMQSHRNVLHNVLRYTNSLGITAEDRIAWIASLSGGQGIATAWTALLNGATLCPRSMLDRGMNGLDEWLASQRITVLDTLPSVLRSAALTWGGRRIEGVRIVRLASEAGLRSDYQTFRRHFPSDCVLASVLGSSETGIMASALLSADDEVPEGPLSVGRAAEGIRLVLADGIGGEAPDGEPGEIHVVGRYLSQGYWGDPEMTAARFTGDGAQRRFRTGDLGRRTDPDRLTVLGRIDSQVKVRGHRLQLEEVEGAVAAQPGVAAAAVTAAVTASGDTTLTCYVVADAGPAVDPATLRHSLTVVLPGHAIPAAIVLVDALPLTATGKLDRARLGELDRARLGEPESDDGAVSVGAGASFGGLEDSLRSLWERLLDHRPIEVSDDFFAIGGHSLLAMVMLVEIERRFGVRLTPRALFASRTIEHLAGLIRAPRQPDGANGRAADVGPLILLPGMRGTSFNYRALVDTLGDAYPLHLLDAPWWDGRASGIRSVPQLAAHFVSELQRFQSSGPYRLGGSSFGGAVALEMAQQLSAAGHEIALLVVLDTYLNENMNSRRHPRHFAPRPHAPLGIDVPGPVWTALRHLRFRAYVARRARQRTRRRVSYAVDQRRFGAVREQRRAGYVFDLSAAMALRYRPAPYHGRVVLFRCTQDLWPAPDRGWGAVAQGGLEIHDMDCRHGAPLRPPLVSEFAPRLAALIERSAGTSLSSGSGSSDWIVGSRPR